MAANISSAAQGEAGTPLLPVSGAVAGAAKRPLETNVAAGFASALAILVLIALIQHWTIQKFVENDRRVVQTNEVLAQLEATLSGVWDAEAGLRAYVMMGIEYYPPLGRAAVDDALEHLRKIRQLTSDNPRQQQRLNVLEPLITARFAALQHVAELAKDQGIEAVREFNLGAGGWQGLDEIRKVVEEMQGEEQILLQQRTRMAEASAGRTTWVSFLGSLTALLLIALAAWLFRNDFTERNRAEEQLLRSEERFRLLIERVKDYAIITLDPQGRVTTWNSGAEQIKGFRAEEIIGQHFSRLYPQEDRDRGKPEMELEVAAAEGRYEDRDWRARKDGSRYWANTLITALRDPQGQLIGFIKITRDLSERKRAEEALRSSEERFRAVAESANDAFISGNQEGNIIHWNHGAERIFGYTAAEALGKPLTLIMPERLHAAHEEGMRRYLSTGVARVVGKTVELTGRKKDGTELPLELSRSSWRTAEGTFFTVVIRDITERKRAEDEIINLNEGLQERNEELRAANHELEAFTYSVSHDLRAPLRHIDGFSKLLLEDHSRELSGEAREYLSLICDGAREMSQLVDEMLNLARIGRQELSLEVTGLDDLVQNLAINMAAQYPDRAIHWKVQPLPFVECDRSLLKQVFTNLLSNAVKFTGPREVAVIEVGSFQQDGETVFFVRDNGVGFDRKHVDKLFGVFQRLHRQEDFEGTGVGLAIVQRVVNKHGGRVWAEGELNRGAVFYFTLGKAKERSGEIFAAGEETTIDGRSHYGHSLSRG
jgi:PAS domain S-box-containing protein